MNKNYLLGAALLLIGYNSAQAQSKIKDGSITATSSLPGANSILELESNKRGLLMPRIALTATTSASPLSAHVAGMTVYNTATSGAGATAVTPGYYYNDGSKWVKIAGEGSSSTEPWYDISTNAAATSNTQNIYQKGNVRVGLVVPNYDTNANFSFVASGDYASVPGWTGGMAIAKYGYIKAFSYYNASTGGEPRLTLERSRGTALTPSPVSTGDALGSITFTGFTAAGTYRQTSYITSTVEKPGPDANSGNLLFYTTDTGFVSAERMRISPSGYVGIGTSSPTRPLHVVSSGFGGIRVGATGNENMLDMLAYPAPAGSGNVRVDNNLNATSGGMAQWTLFRTTNTTGNKELIMFAGDGSVSEVNKLSVNGNSYLNGGKVGIGTITPAQKLHVNGQIRIDTLSSGASTDSIVTADATGVLHKRASSGVLASISADTTNDSWIDTASNTVLKSGFVGIGISAPIATLDIRTSNSVNGEFIKNTTTNSRVKGLTASANASLTANGVFANVGIHGETDPTVASGITQGGTETGGYFGGMRNLSGPGDNGTVVDLNGVWTLYGHHFVDASANPLTTNVYGAHLSGYARSGTITNLYDLKIDSLNGTSSVTNHWSIYNENKAPSYFAGKIGVGTSAPGFPLHVEGSSFGGIRLSTTGSTNAIDIWSSAAESRLQVRNARPLTLWTNDIERMRIDSIGNVGIGTTSPTAPLQITEAGLSTRIGGNYVFFDRPSYNYLKATDNSGILTFGTGGVNHRMVIDAAGNVGVGTTAPSNTLDVAGSARVQTLATASSTDNLVAASSSGVLTKVGFSVANLLTQKTNAPTASPSSITWGLSVTDGQIIRDFRAVDSTPNAYVMGSFYEFKQLAEGSNGNGVYHTIRPWATGTDWTGGDAHQIGYANGGKMWHRSGSLFTWRSWEKVVETSGGETGAIVVPVGSSAQRPSTAVQGMIRYNTTLSKFEGYDGTTWQPLH